VTRVPPGCAVRPPPPSKMGEVKTLSFFLPKRSLGNAVEGPRESAENAAATDRR
jgi:hypothetical protein